MAGLLPLRFREPLVRWMLTAAASALILHGLGWFLGRLALGDDQALFEAQRQMILALAWMIGAMILWRLTPPPSRLHAILVGLGCVLFVAAIGTAFRFLTYLASGVPFTKELLLSYGLLGGVVLAAQFAAALPSVILLQAVALTRRAVPPVPDTGHAGG